MEGIVSQSVHRHSNLDTIDSKIDYSTFDCITRYYRKLAHATIIILGGLRTQNFLFRLLIPEFLIKVHAGDSLVVGIARMYSIFNRSTDLPV